jgi:hypothetical protein
LLQLNLFGMTAFYRSLATALPGRLSAASLLTVAAGGFLTACPQTAAAQLFQVNADAVVSTTCSPSGFTLTPDVSLKRGSVWSLQQLTLAKSFVFTGNFYLGTNDGGADGMTFTIHRSVNGTASIGDGSQSLGSSGVTPAVAVEFDTYDNGTVVYDIPADHIGIFKNGNVGTPVTFNTPAGGTATAIAAAVDGSGNSLNIENGVYYPVRITWNVKTKTLQVYFNNVLRATYSEDFAATVFNNNSLVYWGVTAATGGASNKMEACGLRVDYDQDTDGLTDIQDADDDNDGIADNLESGGADATGDADSDGILNYLDADFGPLNARGVVASLDADGDGLPNQFDLDADADGIPDVVEGTDGKMAASFMAIYSAATGQYTTAVDASGRPTSTTAYTTVPDTDGDKLPDYLDTDADADTKPDWVEGFDDNSNARALDDFQVRAAAFVTAGGRSASYPNTDANSNSVADWLEDSDNNGIPNYLDVSSSYYHDADGDGLVDLLDPTNFGTGYAAVSGYPDANKNSVTDYRDAAAPTPLPVQLAAFEARATGMQALLTWSTASEVNNAYFVPEASTDGQTFVALGKVAGAGNSSQPRSYTFSDANLARYASTTIYYRLRQVDFDGKIQFSAVRPVATSAGSLAIAAVPNPFTSELTLQLQSGLAGPASLLVLDATGRRQATISLELLPGTTQVRVPQAVTWPLGMYLVRLTQGSEHYVQKVVRQ